MVRVLRRGDTGPEVARLQWLLRVHGFPPGPLDGRFGPATEAAVKAFQRARGLVPDGIVGPRTRRALEPESDASPPSVLDALTPELVAAMFPHTPRASIERHLPAVRAALSEFDLADKPMALAALATIRAESEGFEPVEERISSLNTSPGGHPFDLYDHRRDLGNRGPRDGWTYRGRGFVQLTGRANYARISRRLGLGRRLVDEPDLACEPGLAARILACFLAARRDAIARRLWEGDILGARRLVNGGLHGLARFRDALLRGDALLDDPAWPRGTLAEREGRLRRVLLARSRDPSAGTQPEIAGAVPASCVR